MFEVEKAMFLGVENPCEIIFCLLWIQKCDLDEVEEAVSSGRMALRTHYLPSGCR
jgi:hypothetical protein